MRETAPRRASKDMFSKMNETEWKHSPPSIAVPGQLAGLYKVHKQYGKLPWESLVRPAENLARKGFKISQSLSQKTTNGESIIMANEELQRIFAPNGELLIEGQTLRLRKLADTLAAIAKQGMNKFYSGSIAQWLVEDIKKVNGIITKEDLQKYRVITREPLVAHALGYKMLTVPPPASGGAAVILILKTLSKYNVKGVPTPLLVRWTIEALKYALSMRMNLGDPGFVNISNALKSMISDSTAEKLKNLIDDQKTFDPPHYGSKWSQLNDHGTSHICIVDQERNVIMMTTSINTRWGSKFMSPSTGIFLNNQMYDFSIPTSKVRPGAPANFVSPFKRPLSSMAPTILEKILKELKKKGHHLRKATSGMTTFRFVVQKLTRVKKAGRLVAVRDPRKVCLTLVRSFAILLLLLFLASNPKTARAGRGETVIAGNGVVATDETECSKIGRDMLRRGGHAVDAAVAAALCLGVTSPSYSGLGGGGFMLVRSSRGDAKVFDMREMAPGRASKDMFSGDISKWKTGPLAIAVPGQLAGLYTAHKQYGKIPWEALVKPAENLARKGFTISQALFKSITSAESIIMADNELRSIFAPNGKLLSPGQTLHLRKLADTLAAISKHGMNIFYDGSMAQNLVNDIQKAGGIITKEDFLKYRVILRKPLVANVLGYQVVTVPPPASGGAMMILILKILSNYNATGVSISLGMHRAIEALKYALALRTNLGDPGFVNVTNVLKNMISTSYAKKLMKRINDNKTFDPAHYGSKWSQIYDHGTSHLCVIDNRRNVVTMTISLNSYFGSKFVSPSTGIFLNNQMYDFAIPTSSTPPPSPANFIRPYKRPLSSMAPSIFIKGGQVRVAVGAAGGLLIPDAITQVLINYLNLKIDPFNSVRAPRFYHMLYPNVLYYENYTSQNGDHYRFPSQILDELRKKGHVLQGVSHRTVCQFVIQKLTGPNSGKLVAISDPRKGGCPAGY